MATQPREEFTILFEPGEELTKQLVEGYQEDPFFKDKWARAKEQHLPHFQGQAFQVDERGLLYLCLGDDDTKLCIPRATVPTILACTHNSPLFSAHEGPHKLMQKLSLCFYLPTLRKDMH